MPYFGPIPGAQAVAWDGAAQLLGLTVGKFTEFGLYGGGTYHGPASTDLDITALDPAVVTVHELPTSNGSGWRRLRLLALKQGTTVIRGVVVADYTDSSLDER
jgi:hypothetical protein